MARVKRIHVMGISGSGKTTTAERLAHKLGVPHVELDAINWQPDWQMLETDIFRRRVARALAGDAWVVDGNYSKVRDIVWARVQRVIFLDLPLRQTMARLLRRTVRRALGGEELWGGNRENLVTALFSRDSLFIYALRTRRRRQREFAAAQQDPALSHVRFQRLGSQAEIDAFIANLSL